MEKDEEDSLEEDETTKEKSSTLRFDFPTIIPISKNTKFKKIIPVESKKQSILKNGKKTSNISFIDSSTQTEEDAKQTVSGNMYARGNSPASISFQNIISRRGSFPRQSSVQQLFKRNSFRQTSSKFKIINELQEDSEENMHAWLKSRFQQFATSPNISKSELINTLKQWRSQQVEKLHEELKRLNSIEELMKSIDEDRFEPFIEKSVSMKLNEMQKARKE